MSIHLVSLFSPLIRYSYFINKKQCAPGTQYACIRSTVYMRIWLNKQIETSLCECVVGWQLCPFEAFHNQPFWFLGKFFHFMKPTAENPRTQYFKSPWLIEHIQINQRTPRHISNFSKWWFIIIQFLVVLISAFGMSLIL